MRGAIKKRFIPFFTAAVLAVGAFTASAADLSVDESTELRARAERLQAERAQGLHRVQDNVPIDRSRGDVRLNRDRSDIKADKPRGEVKRPKTAKPKKAKKTKKARRSVKDIPGALVRDR